MKNLCVLLMMLVCLLAPSMSGFVITLDANEDSCFFEHLSTGDKMGVTFEVGVGGRLDIDFRITSPGGRTLHEGLREKANTYSFIAEQPGPYTYCFSNKMSVRAKKTVTFTVATKSTTQEAQPQKNAEEGSSVDKEMKELLASIRAVKESQGYLRTREKAHRDTSESSNARIQWWSILQAVILFGLFIFQIFYLRNFFEVKQTV